MTVLILWLSVLAPLDSARVHTGHPGSSHVVELPGAAVANALDLSYDRSSKLLYTLEQREEMYFLRSWTNKGARVREWTIASKNVDFISILFQRAGRPRVLLVQAKELYEITFPAGTNEVVKKRIPFSILEYDRGLAPIATGGIIRRLSGASIRPVARPSGDVLSPSDDLSAYLVNARSVDDACLAWTDDLAVISFGTRGIISVGLSSYTPSGQVVHSREIRRVLETVRESEIRQTGERPLLFLVSIVLSKSLAAYSLRIESKTSTKYRTIMVNTGTGKARGLHDGVVARQLVRYR